MVSNLILFFLFRMADQIIKNPGLVSQTKGQVHQSSLNYMAMDLTFPIHTGNMIVSLQKKKKKRKVRRKTITKADSTSNMKYSVLARSERFRH